MTDYAWIKKEGKELREIATTFVKDAAICESCPNATGGARSDQANRLKLVTRITELETKVDYLEAENDAGILMAASLETKIEQLEQIRADLLDRIDRLCAEGLRGCDETK